MSLLPLLPLLPPILLLLLLLLLRLWHRRLRLLSLGQRWWRMRAREMSRKARRQHSNRKHHRLHRRRRPRRKPPGRWQRHRLLCLQLLSGRQQHLRIRPQLCRRGPLWRRLPGRL
jgi:hypothetical protein